ncbi:hypothetical protein OJAV_G00121640 [Oryzias javanicus]|uniref:Uncharacterized protein n=1 Tax=Oryzias javanicus TaxID=123683 RepID=A0A3S2PG49_ORYJA|nr:hypothetical protein OJAV_G00121640 [Oryzias javanicus]
MKGGCVSFCCNGVLSRILISGRVSAWATLRRSTSETLQSSYRLLGVRWNRRQTHAEHRRTEPKPSLQEDGASGFRSERTPPLTERTCFLPEMLNFFRDKRRQAGTVRGNSSEDSLMSHGRCLED